MGHSCKECDDWLTFKHIKIGTCLVVKWTCPNGQAGHSSGSWASQTMLRGMYAGNVRKHVSSDCLHEMVFVSEQEFCYCNVAVAVCLLSE